MTEWLTFITTLILAGITLWYVLLTRKMVKISQEMLKISNTPEVQVFLTSGMILDSITARNLCIQNIGTGFAFDIKFSGNFNSQQAERRIIKDGISYLGPDKRYEIPTFSSYKSEDPPENILTINVVYTDSTKKRHCKTFRLNYKTPESYPQIGDPSLESIAHSLKGISRNLIEMKKNSSNQKR